MGRLTRKSRMRKRTKRLWRLKRGVRPAIMAKQNARLIWPGPASEFKALNVLAIAISI